MKKIFVFLLFTILICSLLACKATVELHCDGEGCQNTVKVTGEDDESRVIFCQECKNAVLGD